MDGRPDEQIISRLFRDVQGRVKKTSLKYLYVSQYGWVVGRCWKLVEEVYTDKQF